MELLEGLGMAVVFCTLLAPMITFMFIIDDLEDKIEEKGKTIKRMEVGVQNQMDREKELLERIAHLEHHQATTIGLWATDKYDAIPKRIANLFFEIK